LPLAPAVGDRPSIGDGALCRQKAHDGGDASSTALASAGSWSRTPGAGPRPGPGAARQDAGPCCARRGLAAGEPAAPGQRAGRALAICPIRLHGRRTSETLCNCGATLCHCSSPGDAGGPRDGGRGEPQRHEEQATVQGGETRGEA